MKITDVKKEDRLGYEVEDMVTGFKGIVTGRVEYLTGCNQILVNPRVGKDGSYKESLWLDEDRLIAGKKKINRVEVSGTANGFGKAPDRR